MTSFAKLRRRASREAKHVRLRVVPCEPAEHPVLHIVGCQRSGTTMLTELLDRDRRVRVFGELGHLFDDEPRHHRLREPEVVRRELGRSGAALNVVKPLVESHRCRDLLDLQPGASAIWMFRHYRDVASSNLKRFGIDNGRRNLRAIVDDDQDDWRNAGVTHETRELVRSLFTDDMAPHDAAALFWYCRNTIWFDDRLASEPRIRMCRYEQLVRDPDPMIEALYRWVGLDPPRGRVADDVHSSSIGKGTIEIGGPVRSHCESMWEQLLAADREHALLVVP